MQNPNPHTNTSPAAPSIEEERARDQERARAGILGGKRGVSDLFAMFFGRGDEQPGEDARPRGTPHDAGAARDSGPRVDHGAEPDNRARVTLDELLPVFRAPIEWALARAERHAQGDPVDLAAIDRVRAVYQSRLAWIGSGGALGEERPRFRPTDLITAVGLVVGSIDPSFAQRTSAGIREGLLDALADLIPLGLAHTPGAADATHPASTFWYVDEVPEAPVPFGASCFGAPRFSTPVPLGARRVPRAVVPACCCWHGYVL